MGTFLQSNKVDPTLLCATGYGE